MILFGSAEQARFQRWLVWLPQVRYTRLKRMMDRLARAGVL